MGKFKNLDEISTQSLNYLDKVYLKNNSAIVFDIDDTLIDKGGIGGIIPQIYKILKHAYNLGIFIFLVTSRIGLPYVIEHTYNQLNKLDIPYSLIFFKKNINGNDYTFKRESRRYIKYKGFNTIMSFGDNHWDVYDYPNTNISEFSGVPMLLKDI